MEKIKTTVKCADCGKTEEYMMNPGYPKKYCTECGAIRKAKYNGQATPQAATPQLEIPYVEGHHAATLMSQKEIGMCAGGLMKCYAEIGSACIIAQTDFNAEETIHNLLDAYHIFVKKLEENG